MVFTTQKMVLWPALALQLLLVAACSGPPQPPPQAAVARTEAKPAAAVANPAKVPGLTALDAAREMLGVSYRYGGADPRGFDCSGLVQYAFERAGVTLPRTSQEIFRRSQLISPQELQPGDLVFFAIAPSKVSHVGIYAGNRYFIHSPSSGKGVSYADLENPYWQQRLVGVGRL